MANLAIIGAGSMGRSLALATHGSPWGRVLYVCDPDEAAGRALAGATDAQWLAEPGKALEDPVLDAVVIATPQISHPPLAAAAAKADKHALCEKPLALSTKECRHMIRAFRKADRQLMVGHILRFDATHELFRQLAGSGDLGRPQAVLIQRSLDGWGYGGWRLDRRAHGGMFLEVAVHETDFALTILGVPVEVSAECSGIAANGMEDLAVATVRFEGGAFATLRYGLGDPWGATTIEVHCEGGALRRADVPEAGVEVRRRGEKESRFHGVEPRDTAAAEMEAFCTAIDDGRPVPIPGEAGLRAVAVAEAIVTSYQTHRPVRIKGDPTPR